LLTLSSRSHEGKKSTGSELARNADKAVHLFKSFYTLSPEAKKSWILKRLEEYAPAGDPSSLFC
jgi:hypothetical protein